MIDRRVKDVFGKLWRLLNRKLWNEDKRSRVLLFLPTRLHRDLTDQLGLRLVLNVSLKAFLRFISSDDSINNKQTYNSEVINPRNERL